MRQSRLALTVPGVDAGLIELRYSRSPRA